MDLLDLEVDHISTDNRDLKDRSVFIAFEGTGFDTHQVLAEVQASDKVLAVVCERQMEGVDSIIVADGRKALSIAAVNFYATGNAALKSVAVTGTNGKTTISYIIDSIFESARMKSIRLGTTEYKVVDTILPANNTTPGSLELNRMIRSGVDAGAEALVMEVSSHALHQNRVSGIQFDAGIFTNLTGDHLDYHGTMDAYYQDKRKLFTPELCRKAVINIDSPYGKQLASETKLESITCSVDTHADIQVKSVEYRLTGTTATVQIFDHIVNISTHLAGKHNLNNILCAVGAAKAMGLDDATIIAGIRLARNIPGRLEKIEHNGAFYFVDYAHTDDALENVLTALSSLKTARVITLFGCGGDRDKTKRPRMAAAAEKQSDVVIVTSDNPRTEEPDEIIQDILKGFKNAKAVNVEADRRKAIASAVAMAEPNDIVLIAGKGHEDYQILGTEKIHFDDREELLKLIGVADENG